MSNYHNWTAKALHRKLLEVEVELETERERSVKLRLALESAQRRLHSLGHKSDAATFNPVLRAIPTRTGS